MRSVAFFLLAVASLTGAVAQTSFYLPSFSPTYVAEAGGVTFNGAASLTNDGVLTPAAPGYVGTIFFNTEIDASTAETASFSAYASFVIDSTVCSPSKGCGTGMTFMLQSSKLGPNFYHGSGIGDQPGGVPNGQANYDGYVDEGPSFVVAFNPNQSGANSPGSVNGKDLSVWFISSPPYNALYDPPTTYKENDFTYAGGVHPQSFDWTPGIVNNYALWVDYNYDFGASTGTMQIYLVNLDHNDNVKPATPLATIPNFDIYDANTLDSTSYWFGFTAGTNYIGEYEKHVLVQAAFQSCASAPCTLPISGPLPQVVYTGAPAASVFSTTSSSSQLKDCRIYQGPDVNLLTGYAITDADSNKYCCVLRGYIGFASSPCSSTQCDVVSCGASPYSSCSYVPANPALTTPSSTDLCHPSSSCYAFGERSAVAEAIPVYGFLNDALFVNGPTVYATASSYRNVYMQAPSNNVIAAYGITVSTPIQSSTSFGCQNQGLISNGPDGLQCGFLCQSQMVMSSTFFYQSTVDGTPCYMQCIASTSS